MASLTDLDHVVFVVAEDVALADVEEQEVALEPGTSCLGYRPTPEGEERAERLWPAYAVVLRESGYTVHLRASMPDTLGDVTVIEARADVVTSVIAHVDDLPPNTLLLVALATGDHDDADDPDEGTGPGVLLVRTPWAFEDRLYDEPCDHTSVMRLVEAWTRTRGRAARVPLPARRLAGLDDLVGALDLTDDEPTPADPAPLTEEMEETADE